MTGMFIYADGLYQLCEASNSTLPLSRIQALHDCSSAGEEGVKVSWFGVHKFIQHYSEWGSIDDQVDPQISPHKWSRAVGDGAAGVARAAPLLAATQPSTFDYRTNWKCVLIEQVCSEPHSCNVREFHREAFYLRFRC
jgi:hypothetical protein